MLTDKEKTATPDQQQVLEFTKTQWLAFAEDGQMGFKTQRALINLLQTSHKMDKEMRAWVFYLLESLTEFLQSKYQPDSV